MKFELKTERVNIYHLTVDQDTAERLQRFLSIVLYNMDELPGFGFDDDPDDKKLLKLIQGICDSLPEAG